MSTTFELSYTGSEVNEAIRRVLENDTADTPVIKGEADNTVVQKGTGARAVSEGSVAYGSGNIAGCLGYYFTEIYKISDTKGRIRLSKSKPTDQGVLISKTDIVNPNTDFDTPAYKLGYEINLDCGNHYRCFGTIDSIEHDIVTFSGGNVSDFEAGMIESCNSGGTINELVDGTGTVYILGNPGYDDYTFSVVKQPDVGIAEVAKYGSVNGIDCKAQGVVSQAEGRNTVANGSYAHAEGRDTIAGYSAHAEGQRTKALGQRAHAEGLDTTASGMCAHSEGCGTKAEGVWSHAEGIKTTASEEAAHAEGYLCTASGRYSHAEGTSCIAYGIAAHAEGNKSEALGDYSHAGGVGTKATYIGQYAIGRYNDVDNNALFIIGNGESDSDRKNAFKVYNSGNVVVSGTLTANGGIKTRVSAGQQAGTTLGSCATAEGNNTTSSGNSTHAEGNITTASGNFSHAEGNRTTASGIASHAEGSNTQAIGNFSHAAGEHTIAQVAHQTVIGKYNTDNAKALFIIGNGSAPVIDKDTKEIITPEVRSNAFEVISQGAGPTASVSMKLGDTIISETELSAMKGGGFVAQSSAPTNTKLLWIDTTSNGGLKYHNGSGWVSVPVRFS